MRNRKMRVLLFTGLAFLAASALGFGAVLAAQFGFTNITTGFITKYHEQPLGCVPNPCLKQDVSGAATDGKVIIFADDGGDPSDFNFIRVVMGGLPDNNAVNLPLTLLHKDLEGATFWKGHFVVTTSLSKAGAGNEPFRRLTRFKVNEKRNQLISEKSVDLRDQPDGGLMGALQQFASPEAFGSAWFTRINSLTDERAGALNIEGLSRTGDAERDSLYWGIRGPLFGADFALPCCPPPSPLNLAYQISLRKGKAIIAEVERPFSNNPSFNFNTLDLFTGSPITATSGGNHGIRGIEWIPAMKGFVIIGGPVARGEDFSLWFWNGKDGLERVLERLDRIGPSDTVLGAEFRKLCRPESVFQMKENGDKFLVITSEQSGAPVPCSPAEPDPPPSFTFMKAKIVGDGDDDEDGD